MRCLVVSVVLLFLVVSCLPQRTDRWERTDLAGDEVTVLRQRADRLWSAKEAQDWATVFQFQDPAEHDQSAKDEFIRWCVEEEPFRILSYEIDDVDVDGNLGWVDVRYRTSLNKFPDIPARDAETWQKWRRIDGMWYPVPTRELASCPEAPSKRDASAEARLRTRFLESWTARQGRDWPRLYALTDPADREDVPEDEYAQVEGLFEYLAHEVDWVEVVGQRGRIRVSYEHKVTDTSLSKLPAMTATMIETWIQRDNEWYRDLKRQ